jgi:methyl-accepting chemotaxis protein
MTQQNAALVEESTTAAEQLKEQANRLAQTVGGFTLSQRYTAGLSEASSQAGRETERA